MAPEMYEEQYDEEVDGIFKILYLFRGDRGFQKKFLNCERKFLINIKVTS